MLDDPKRGRTVAITGAARGIGLAIARECAARGARCALGDLDQGEARAAAEQLGDGAIGLELDVADRGSFTRFLDAVGEQLGSLDVLVNNAGVMTVGPLIETDLRAASKLIDVNVKGVLYGMQLALPRLSSDGQIVNIVSSSAWIAPPFLAAYSASKHAGRALTDSVREEVRGSGIAITGVYPGVVRTDLAAGTKPARGQRMIEPEEVGWAVADALESRRPEVFVPRGIAGSLRVWQALPLRARSVVGRAFGIDRLYSSGVDLESRRAYEQTLAD